MTDVATKNGASGDAALPGDARSGADPSSADTVALTASGEPPATTGGAEWAPVEPEPKKRHLGLWIGIPSALILAGLGVASAILIAPGAAVAGVAVGGMTAGAAADAVQERFADTTIVLTGAGGDATVTAADLGATVDAKALANQAYEAAPMWNVTAWNPAPLEAAIELDPERATEALRGVAPDLYSDPVDATLAFDAASGAYVVTPAEVGTGIDVASVQTALSDAFAAGEGTVSLEAAPVDIPALTSTEAAQAGADQANTIISQAGFYVGEERTVPVDAATAASWLTVTINDTGAVDIAADAAAIEAVVPTLAEAVNRAPVDSNAIVNAGGKVLRESQVGVTGREIGDTSSVASDYAAQLSEGNAVFQVPVTETAFATNKVVRLLEVDLGDQRLYLKENDAVVDSWAISSGKGSTPTFTGRYTINAHVPTQTMRGRETVNGVTQLDAAGKPIMYETPNVPWITYFNGDQGFHGVYWHSNWGSPMSHGCVGMPIPRAQQVYDWSSNGTDVWIHE